MMRGFALVAATAIFLSGCASGNDAAPPPTTPTDGANPATANFTALKFPLAAPVHKVVWANGTYTITDTCNTGGCLLDPRAFRPTDITAELPEGAPVRLLIQVDFTYGPTADFGGGLEAWVETQDAAISLYRHENALDGHVEVEVLLKPGTKTDVVVAAYSPGSLPDTPYTMSIQIDSNAAPLPSGVPVAVELAGGDEIRASTLSGGKAPFFLYTPNDVLIGRFEGNHTLPGNAPRGAYALLVPFGEPDANVTSNSGATTMKLLGIAFELGPAGDPPETGAYDVDWQATGDLIGVGILVNNVPTPVGLAPMISLGYSVQMTGPAGFQLDTGDQCGVCLSFGQTSLGIGSGLGDDRVSAGTYHIHSETLLTYDLRITPFAVYFDRS